jgi:hypothetical protein
MIDGQFSPVTQSATLIFANSKLGYFEIILSRFSKIEDIEAGVYHGSCQVIFVLSNTKTQTVATSDEEGLNSSLTLSNAVLDGNTLQVTGNASEIELYDPFLETTITLTDVILEAKIKSIVTEDFISFEINGAEHFFPTKNLSGYDYIPFYSDDMDLVLSANISNWPLATALQGVALEVEGFEYPPTTQTVSGYSNGLRLFYNFDDGPCGDNYQEYNSGYNSIDDPDNTTMTITSVVSNSKTFVLTGTFSGRITGYSSFDDYLQLSNGKFKVTIPKIN